MKLEVIQRYLNQYLKDLDDICTIHNIQYWADGGTLLGAVREKGIIPHDDDGDICMYPTDLEKLETIIKTKYPQYVIYGIDGVMPKFMKIDCPHVWIDIFLVENFPDIVHYKHTQTRRFYLHFYHYPQDLFPLQRAPFEDFQIWIPNNPIPYLQRGYGDWKTPVPDKKHPPVKIG